MQILPVNIKSLAGSVATLANWLTSWAVTITANLLLSWSSGGPLSLSLSLSLSHACPRAHTHTHTHMVMRTYMQHARARTQGACVHTCNACTHTRTHTPNLAFIMLA